MPFKTEKQRRYMHANLPDIANRWERDYAGGGITNLGGRIGFDSGTNYKTRKELIEEADLEISPSLLDYLSEKSTVGSDKYNIKFSPAAELSLSKFSEGDYDVNLKNIMYGGTTTANLGPVNIGMDITNYLDKYDVTEDDVTVEKDTRKDEQLAFSLGIDLDTLYARIESDKDFKEFYLTIRKTFNQGGVVPAHEAGIYGLAEGGNIRLQPHTATDLLVQKTSSGERPKYQPPGHVDAPAPHGDVAHEPGGRFDQPSAPETQTVERDDGRHHPGVDTGKEEEPYVMVDGQKVHQSIWGTGADPREKGPIEYYGQRKIQNQIKTQTDKTREYILRNLQKLDPDKYYEGMPGWKAAYEKLSSLPTPSLIGILRAMYKEHKLTSEGKALLEEWSPFIGGVPGSNPQAYDDLWLALEKRKSKYKYGDEGPEGPEGPGAPKETGITYDDMEGYNEKVQASTAWRQEQEKVDRSKQMAYWRMMMSPYMGGAMGMAAEGGRVPAGYNTGGLSNLFKLKNV